MLGISSSALIVAGVTHADVHSDGKQPQKTSNHGCTLGFSTYGMETLTTEQAVETLSRIGFDAIELTVRSGWDADSAKLDKTRRDSLRHRIADSSLKLSSLMEHVFPTTEKHQANALERLKMAAGVAHDLAPETPPLVQTVLGSGNFEALKSQLRDRLADWVRIADESDTTIAIKPHRGGVVSQPAEAVWLFEQLGKPSRLRMVYDYSHYAFRNLSMLDTIATSLPFVAHVAVKDATKSGDRVVFDLPGESGSIDFSSLIGKLFEGGYQGDINCEVSSMVSKQPDYDPVAAARTCYQNMSEAFNRSGVPRS